MAATFLVRLARGPARDRSSLMIDRIERWFVWLGSLASPPSTQDHSR